jgi:hypothetical protein
MRSKTSERLESLLKAWLKLLLVCFARGGPCILFFSECPWLSESAEASVSKSLGRLSPRSPAGPVGHISIGRTKDLIGGGGREELDDRVLCFRKSAAGFANEMDSIVKDSGLLSSKIPLLGSPLRENSSVSATLRSSPILTAGTGSFCFFGI